jgi:hypothetical protein
VSAQTVCAACGQLERDLQDVSECRGFSGWGVCSMLRLQLRAYAVSRETHGMLPYALHLGAPLIGSLPCK